MGVCGNPTRGVKADFGPSVAVSFELVLRASDDTIFLWPRRNALAEGGGNGTTSWGGLGDFLGGDEVRSNGFEFKSTGGDTSARKVGVLDFGGDEV
jgi:hypothetical protein